jgi:hypothetical protein
MSKKGLPLHKKLSKELGNVENQLSKVKRNSKFRRQHRERLSQVLYIYYQQGQIGREMFAIDGIKPPGNAAKARDALHLCAGLQTPQCYDARPDRFLLIFDPSFQMQHVKCKTPQTPN